MSDFKGIMKGGWHPKGKDGGRESWRGDFKGINQVAGWVGKGKQSDAQAAREHVSRPLATLKDPSSFGPPPKNVNYHGGAALPNEITPHRSGIGAPLSQDQIEDARRLTAEPAEQEEESPSKPPPPALPYRADRTGLRTDNLPPPPVHRDLQQSVAASSPIQSSGSVSQPRLPPRLPSRTNTLSPPVQEAPPPSYNAVQSESTGNTYINQSAVDRLGRAGVSVPALGIGSQTEANPWKNERGQSQASSGGQLSELQSRFARMKSPSQDTAATSNSTSNQAQSPSQTAMPSWQQGQSAFKTASNLRTNPQSVSLADAQDAAQTAGQAQRSASAFKEKHADTIANAQAKAKAWDQRYKVTSKINKFLDEHSDSNPASPQQQQQQQQHDVSQTEQSYQSQNPPPQAYSPAPQVPQYPTSVQQPIQTQPVSGLSASIARKPPPPPAPRKPANLQAPPPVPMGTKPSFG